MASVILPWENDAPCYGRVFVKGKGGVQSRADGALVMATPKAGILLSSLPLKALVTLDKSDGSEESFCIVNKDLDGILLRNMYLTESSKWNTTDVCEYSNSDIDFYLNQEKFSSFSANVRSNIITRRIICEKQNSAQLYQIERKLFVPSRYELGEAVDNTGNHGQIFQAYSTNPTSRIMSIKSGETRPSAYMARSYSNYISNGTISYPLYAISFSNGVSMYARMSEFLWVVYVVCVSPETLVTTAPDATGHYHII